MKISRKRVVSWDVWTKSSSFRTYGFASDRRRFWLIGCHRWRTACSSDPLEVMWKRRHFNIIRYQTNSNAMHSQSTWRRRLLKWTHKTKQSLIAYLKIILFDISPDPFDHFVSRHLRSQSIKAIIININNNSTYYIN